MVIASLYLEKRKREQEARRDAIRAEGRTEAYAKWEAWRRDVLDNGGDINKPPRLSPDEQEPDTR